MNQLPEETALSLPHRLSLENRQQLHLTGITEVESFDETAVILHTAADTLIIRGEGLHLRALDSGKVEVDGQVSAIVYEAARRTGGGLPASGLSHGIPGPAAAAAAVQLCLFGAALGLHYDLIRPLRRALPRLTPLWDLWFGLSSLALCCLFCCIWARGSTISSCFWGRPVAAASIFSSAARPFAGRWHGVLTFCPVLRKKYTFF